MRRIYNYLGKVAYAGLFVSAGIWLRLSNSRRVRIMVFDKKDRLLLLRNWLGPQNWALPGGGCRYLETDQAAAVRELYEETGIKVDAKQLKFVYEYKHPGLGYAAPVYTVKINKVVESKPIKRINKLEIIDQAWFKAGDIPKESPQVKEALRQLQAADK